MGVICSCGDPTFGNMGRPNCVVEMKAVAFPIIIPRYKADGVTRNTINVLSPTLGDDIKALIQAATAATDRIYPFPRCENITYNRTDTVYDTAPSTRKYKLDGVGAVRTFNFELWGKEAAHQILRELKKYGCTELDFFLVDIAGSIWGIKDNVSDTTMRGYEMSTETFDSFKEYATDTTIAKTMISFDMDSQECEENSYAITAGELGYKATTLKGLVSAFITLVELDASNVQFTVSTGFGTAGDRDKVVGLVDANFAVVSDTGVVALIPPVVETSAGVYTYPHLDAEITIGDLVTGSVINATGYDVSDGTFVAAL